ncbi:MAG TPA: porin, partial [Vicinamibacteria bacterium]
LGPRDGARRLLCTGAGRVRARSLALLAVVVLLGASARGQEKGKKEGGKKTDPPPGWVARPFSLENASAGFRIALKGYVQADVRSFRDWTAGDEETGHLRADEFEWRRARIGLEGEWKRFAFEVDVDPAFDAGDELKDAWADLRFAKALRVRGGYMKVPVSPEFLTSPAKTDFVERAAAVDSLGPNRDWGAIVHGEIARAVEYQAGVFQGDARASDGRAGTTVAGRLVLKPARWLDLGGSYSQGDVEAAPSGPGLDPEPKGLAGQSVTGYRFFPSVFVDGWRLRWGADARLQAGPVSVWGEFLESREERKGQGPNLEDLPDVRGDGWSVNATWLLTGERKVRAVRPDRSLFGGPGAVELAVRYEELRFDDVENEGFESAGSRARNIRPAGYRAFSGGLSWWPTIFLRLIGDVVVERYEDELRAPEIGNEGSYVTLLARVQVHLP